MVAQDAPRLLLNSGTYTLTPSSNELALTALNDEGMSLFRIVQFTRPLTQNEQDWLAENVGEVINYLPDHAYTMVLPSDLNAGDFGTLPLYAVDVLSPEMKMTRRLTDLDIPEYAVRGANRIEVVAGLIPHSNTEMVAYRLNEMGYDVTEYDPYHEKLTIEIDLEDRFELASDRAIAFLQVGEDPGEPENFNAIRSARSLSVKNRFTGGRNYDGSGVVVGLGDDGDIGPHADYQGRIIARNTNASSGDHGDHVAGTIFGAGNINPEGEGMAPGADMFYYRYPRNLNDVDADYVSHAVRITNSSYSNGCNAGYTSFSQQMDEDIYDNDHLMHVFSAGNAGSNNCNYGAGAGWGNVTGGHKIGKNVIATANIDANDVIAPSSSRGPSADGRLKPDISSVGSSVFSTIDPHTYGFKTGTSMAAPGVAGAMAQMFQAYEENHSNEPDGGLLKAILMNTADDLGNPGPDFIYGYGRMNILRGIRDIEAGQFITDSITTAQMDSFQISVPANTAELRVMLYWTDPAASPAAGRVLVNDLDLTLKITDTSVLQPWVLDPTPNATALNSNAVRATDTMNNAEQVTLANPAQGNYTVRIGGTNIPVGPQKYYLVYSFVPDDVELTYPYGGEAITTSGSTRIYWDASDGTQGFTLEYSTNNGTSWSNIGNAAAGARTYTWTSVPSTPTNDLLIRITRGTQTDMVDAPVTLINQPNGLRLVQSCPDSFVVAWDPLPGAFEYEVYALGAKYMDSIARTVDTFHVFRNIPSTQEVWWSVAAVPSQNGQPGKRAIARQKGSGLQGCVVVNDIGIVELTSPQPGEIAACHDLTAMPIKARFRNTGLNGQDSIPIGYEFNGTVVLDTLYNTLASGASLDFTFPTTVNASSLGTYTVKVWSNAMNDGNIYNDTSEVTFTVASGGTAKTAPYTQNFDGFSNCPTTTDCGATVCGLFDDWNNLSNGTFDDIDFRTNSGSTPSSGTGPSNDNTLGTSAGKYLYLEASGGCNFQEALLVSPCIDLTNTTLPQLEFAYHMQGSHIGELHVDLFSNGEWFLDIVPAKVGPQGSIWMNENLSLVPWAGQVVSIRFRASTGSDYQGDIAIDDFSITQASTAPIAGFGVSNPTPCTGEVVDLIDQSTNVPSSWTWSISPNTYNFVNGTSSTSQNPQVVFNALGNYTITLVASNTNGADSITTTNAVIAGNGLPLPIIEDFPSVFVPSGWFVENPDGLNTWESQTCIEYNGSAGRAFRVNNFGYGSTGQRDYLNSPSIDLSTATTPSLVFDVAYVGTTSNKNDRLQIQISSDCGNTWDPAVYDRTTGALTTLNINQNNEYIPTGAGHWRRDTIDLTAYAGSSVKIRFVNITDGGNALYLDNVQLYDLSITPPSSAFTSNLADSCLARTYTFTYPGAAGTSVTWDFGSGASPAAATGNGPHNVTYTFGGSKLVEMTAVNGGGTSTSNVVFPISQKPNAGLTYAFVPGSNGFELQFSSGPSSGSIDTYFWDFGDGSTSNDPNPLYLYTNGGSTTVMLITSNRCGPDTATVTIGNINLPEDAPSSWILAPNPASSQISLFTVEGDLGIQSAQIFTVNGKQLAVQDNLDGKANVNFDITDLPAGVYLLRTIGENESYTMRFAVQR